MKKFKFKLQKLLDIKLAKEEQIKHELGAILGEQNKLRLQQQNYLKKVELQKVEFHEKMKTGRYHYKELQIYSNFSDFADKFVVNTQAEIDQMEPKVNEIRERLIEASKERGVIEKLKDKRHAEWREALRKAEDKESDDMNQRIFMRRKALYKAEDYI